MAGKAIAGSSLSVRVRATVLTTIWGHCSRIVVTVRGTTNGDPSAAEASLAAHGDRTESRSMPFVERHQQRRWDRRAVEWEEGGALGLTKVVDAVLEAARPAPGMVAVDLGTGSGQLALPLARIVEKVWAVDVSGVMLGRLVARAGEEGLDNVVPVNTSMESAEFPEGSVDLVVTNYALHHLLDPDKKSLVDRVAFWLKPGGRFVIGDMMFGRGADSRDREIILHKVSSLARRGPGGWWRIAKNAWRFTMRMEERPVRIDVWEGYLRDAGFDDLCATAIIAEAVVLDAVRRP